MDLNTKYKVTIPFTNQLVRRWPHDDRFQGWIEIKRTTRRSRRKDLLKKFKRKRTPQVYIYTCEHRFGPSDTQSTA